MPETKTKKPNTVRFNHDTGADMWWWEINYSNGKLAAESCWLRSRSGMLHNLAVVHGKQIRDGDTVINGRQHNAWRWDLDAALDGIGLKPYSETYGDDS